MRADDQGCFTTAERGALRGALLGRELSQALHRSDAFRASAMRIAAAGDDLAARRALALKEAASYAVGPSAGRRLVAWLMECAAGAQDWERARWDLVAMWAKPAATKSENPRAGYQFSARAPNEWRAGAEWIASRGARRCVDADCIAEAGREERWMEPRSSRGREFQRASRALYCPEHRGLDDREKTHAREQAKRTMRAAVEAWPTPTEHAILLHMLGAQAARTVRAPNGPRPWRS